MLTLSNFATVTLAEYNNVGGKITRLQSHQTSLLSLFKWVAIHEGRVSAADDLTHFLSSVV